VTLVELLEQETDIDLIDSLVAALGRCGDARALFVLLETLKHSNERVRHSAVRSLGTLGDEETCLRLINLLEDQTMPVRAGNDGISRVRISSALREEARIAVARIRARDLEEPERPWWKFW
jgi:HEAT repeat protein